MLTMLEAAAEPGVQSVARPSSQAWRFESPWIH